MNQNIDALKKEIVKDFKNGFTTSNLITKYGLARSTINDCVRDARIKIDEDNLKSLKQKYAKLLHTYEKNKLELETYKNLECLPTSPQIVKLNAIEKHYTIYPIKMMCRILNVGPGTAYNHINRRVPEHINKIKDDVLKPLVLEVFEKSVQRFGAEKIAQVLRKQGHTISIEKAKQLMNELNIEPYLARKKKPTPSLKEKKTIYYKNKLGDSFTKENPNEAWVGDTSEIIVQQNKYYVCVILDLYSRKAIAHRVSYKNNANLVCNILKDAYESRNEPKDVIFHSDQGTPYTSYKYMQLMKSLHIVSSFSRTARPRDNAVVESFFSFLKKEETHRHDYESLDDLSQAIDDYIEFYNDFRPHSHLNGKTPNEFEEDYYNNKDLSP